MTNIYLIRHGESVANTQGIYQGCTYDTPLSELGWQQVKRLAERCEALMIDKIVASPLLRTFQTASCVAAVRKLPVDKEARILETNHGSWEGKHKDVVEASWPVLYRKWARFPSRVSFPGGEHFLSTQKRVTSWWQEVVSTGSEHMLAVTHDNIIRIIIASVLNMKLNKIWKFHLQPAAITHVVIDAKKVRLVSLNETSHLASLQANLAIHAL